jgi:hypothetical protein
VLFRAVLLLSPLLFAVACRFLLSSLSLHAAPSSCLLNMAPTNKKRASSVPSRSESNKRAAVASSRVSKKPPPKKPPAKKLSSLGFSSTKRQTYQPGTKILLTDGIYDDDVPEKVRGHLFLYEIVEWSENGKMAKIEYKNQVIRSGGDRFRTYKDSDDVQVRFFVWRFVTLCCLLFDF